MNFPYGIADFRKIREGGYFHVDRTDTVLPDHVLEFKALSLNAVGLTSAELVTKTRGRSGYWAGTAGVVDRRHAP